MTSTCSWEMVCRMGVRLGAGESCQPRGFSLEIGPGCWAASPQARYSRPYRSSWEARLIEARHLASVVQRPRPFGGDQNRAAGNASATCTGSKRHPQTGGEVVGLTWPGGAGVFGNRGRWSVTLLRFGQVACCAGPAGVGKTTALREECPGCWRTTWSVGFVGN